MKIINHEYYVSPEIAKLLEKAGFDWNSFAYYDTNNVLCLSDVLITKESSDLTEHINCLAPTLDVAQRWLREVKGYSIYPTRGGYKIYVLDINDSAGFSRTYELNSNLTYEESQESGIKKIIEIILKKGE